jgi:superfamily II DNA or RNA helicase
VSVPVSIIRDEFHRAGAAQWGLGVQRLLSICPSATILGLTATNVRYLDGQRDMAQELFDGHIASEMSLGEAIVRGILPAPKYVLSIFKYLDSGCIEYHDKLDKDYSEKRTCNSEQFRLK